MKERLKMFTFVTGHGETLIDSTQEDHVNKWLESVDGTIVELTQSESERSKGGHHITIGIWYVPGASAGRAESD